MSVKVIDACRVPPVVGEKVMLRVQFAPAATLEPQVLVSAKSVLPAGVTAMLVMVSALVPVLVTVTVWGELVLPTN